MCTLASLPKYLLAATLCITLWGCGNPYKPDLANKPQARVRVVSNLHLQTWASILKDNCLPQTTFGWDSTQQIDYLFAKDNPNRKSIGMPLPKMPMDASFTETIIPAGKPIAIGFSTVGMAYVMACGAGVIFTPIADVNYQVTYQHKSGLDCSIELDSIEKNEGGEIILLPVKEQVLAPKC